MVEAGAFAPGERVGLLDGEVLAMTPQGSVVRRDYWDFAPLAREALLDL